MKSNLAVLSVLAAAMVAGVAVAHPGHPGWNPGYEHPEVAVTPQGPPCQQVVPEGPVVVVVPAEPESINGQTLPQPQKPQPQDVNLEMQMPCMIITESGTRVFSEENVCTDSGSTSRLPLDTVVVSFTDVTPVECGEPSTKYIYVALEDGTIGLIASSALKCDSDIKPPVNPTSNNGMTPGMAGCNSTDLFLSYYGRCRPAWKPRPNGFQKKPQTTATSKPSSTTSKPKPTATSSP